MLADFFDLKEADCRPTSDGRLIDKVFKNFDQHISESGTLPPLETDDACTKKSDNLIGYLKAVLLRVVPVKWLNYSYCRGNGGVLSADYHEEESFGSPLD